MFEFGKHPPRSLESFGVAGLLADNARVFYSSLFTTRHLGRVSDLIAARLQEEGLDELRLRALLLFGAFEVFRANVDRPEQMGAHRLIEPLIVECGVDDEKIAIGVSQVMDEARFPRIDGLVERISSGRAENDFERWLAEIHAHSDRTVLRVQSSLRRVEIISLLGVPGKIAPTDGASKPAIELLTVDASQAVQPPKVEEYVELGDLDYPALLQDNQPGSNAPPPNTGEILVHGATELEEAFRVRAEKLLEDLTGRRIKGSAAQGDNEVIRVKGGGAQQEDEESVFKVGGSSGARIRTKGGAFRVPARPQEAVDETQEESMRLSSGKAASEATNEESSDPNSSGSAVQEIIEKVRKAWPFRWGRRGVGSEAEPVEGESGEGQASLSSAAPSDAGEGTEDEESEEDVSSAGGAKKKKKKVKRAGEPDSDDSDDEESDPAAAKPDAAAAGTSSGAPVDVETATGNLNQEIEAGMERTINKFKNEAAQLKKELENPRAKRWMDGMMSELVAEKARLAEAAKKLNSTVRQKEFEFRQREQVLNEELRRRDDQIKQKNNALARAKDQISQMTMSAERLKSAKAGGADDGHFKQKYTMAQKMLSTTKDENTALAEKIEELKAQVSSMQLNNAGKRNQVAMQDFTALQSKYERSIRQAEEMRRKHQELADKVAELKKERVTGSGDDSKKQLEAAQKMVATHQKEAERLYQKVEEMKRDQIRLQGDLNRVNSELKVARLSASKAAVAAPATPAAGGRSSSGSGNSGTPPKAA